MKDGNEKDGNEKDGNTITDDIPKKVPPTIFPTSLDLDRGVQKKSQALYGKKIAYGITGSIGCLESVKLIREMRRHGADVFCFITRGVKDFIQPEVLTWACLHQYFEEPDYSVSHFEAFDFGLIAPITLHSFSKLALGLCDNATLLMATACLSQKKTLALIPTMSQVLKDAPIYVQHKNTLLGWGVHIWEPIVEENRLKMMEPDVIVKNIIELVR